MENRSINIKWNIIGSFILKLMGIGISFFLLPLTVKYLSVLEYGIWVTLFSVMNWVNFLDMGIGLGLRNKLAEAVSRRNISDIQTYLSTGIAATTVLGIAFLMIFFVCINFLDLQFIFNTKEISESDLFQAVFWTGVFVILTFILSVINQIYYAYQKAAFTGAIQILHNLIMLVIVYYLTLGTTYKMVYFVFAFGVAALFSRICFIVHFFYNHKDVRPKTKYIKWSKIKGISTLGVKFFVIQITCIIMFSSANILITQCLGPEYVRDYDIVFKIFSVITMAHGIVCAPLWSAYTDAYVKKDFIWIKKSLKKMVYMTGAISIMSILLVFKINLIILLVLRMNVVVSNYLAVSICIYTIMICWLYIWTTFLNGIGKIDFQMYLMLVVSIVNVPLSWFLMLQVGVSGVAFSSAFVVAICVICMFFQTKKILSR